MKLVPATSDTELKTLKSHYSAMQKEELELIKADLESREDDLKQVQFAIVTLGILVTLFNKVLSESVGIAAMTMVLLIVGGISGVGIFYSIRLRKTSLQRRVVEIVLKELDNKATQTTRRGTSRRSS